MPGTSGARLEKRNCNEPSTGGQSPCKPRWPSGHVRCQARGLGRGRSSLRSRRLDLDVDQPRGGLGAVERLEVRVGDRDHVAAAVAVEAHRADHLALDEIGVGLDDAGEGEHLLERADARRRGPAAAGPGAAVRKRIASGWRNCGNTSSSGSSSPSAIRSCTSIRSTPTAWRTRSAIWPPGIRAAHSTTTTPPSGVAISCGKAIPFSSPSVRAVQRRDPLRLLELVAVDRRRVDVDPADAEADPRRPQPVGQRQRPRLAVAGDHDPVHLGALDELLEDRLLRRRRRRAPRAGAPRCRPTDSTRKIPRCPPESAGFSTAGKPTSSAARWRSDSVRSAANRGCGTPASASAPPHRDLVRHQVRRLGADPRQPARLGDRRHDRHGAVGRHRQHAVERLARDGLEHRRPRPRSRRRSRRRPLRARARRGCGRRRARAGPSSFARRIARRWWRPAPTKRTVFTAHGDATGQSSRRG